MRTASLLIPLIAFALGACASGDGPDCDGAVDGGGAAGGGCD